MPNRESKVKKRLQEPPMTGQCPKTLLLPLLNNRCQGLIGTRYVIFLVPNLLFRAPGLSFPLAESGEDCG
jgi:hypothetical protein